MGLRVVAATALGEGGTAASVASGKDGDNVAVMRGRPTVSVSAPLPLVVSNDSARDGAPPVALTGQNRAQVLAPQLRLGFRIHHARADENAHNVLYTCRRAATIPGDPRGAAPLAPRLTIPGSGPRGLSGRTRGRTVRPVRRACRSLAR